jgi:hypothetical protein
MVGLVLIVDMMMVAETAKVIGVNMDQQCIVAYHSVAL